LQCHINETLLPLLALKKTTVSIRTCQRWLWKLGYCRKRHQKGVYWDGHEQKDVKQRCKAYLAELTAFECFRAQYAEPDMAEVLPELIADDNEVEHVVLVHDESTIHSNDYQNNHYWLKEGEQVLKKGCGRLIMISAFLCEHYSLLALPKEMGEIRGGLNLGLKMVKFEGKFFKIRVPKLLPFSLFFCPTLLWQHLNPWPEPHGESDTSSLQTWQSVRWLQVDNARVAIGAAKEPANSWKGTELKRFSNQGLGLLPVPI
jgi:hypothetical protein